MARHAETQRLIDAAHMVLAAHHPMTLRQIHYQLATKQVHPNTQQAYNKLKRVLADARLAGDIPWEWM